ncbi:MAG: hypothetical protein KDB18_07345, partial [Salinibacterium sp.]|nr:hypothetical protein [Salinibacterium sp.]
MLLTLDAAFMFLLFGGALIAASFLLDWLFQLPWGARAVMLMLMLFVMARGAWRFFVGPQRIALDDERLALLIEGRHPEYGDDLISALQFERQLQDPTNAESKDLMVAAIEDTAARFKDRDFADVVRASGLRRPALLGLSAVALLLVYGFCQPAHASLWVDRCLFLSDKPWPPDTVLSVSIANLERYNHRIADDGTTEVFVPEGSVMR